MKTKKVKRKAASKAVKKRAGAKAAKTPTRKKARAKATKTPAREKARVKKSRTRARAQPTPLKDAGDFLAAIAITYNDFRSGALNESTAKTAAYILQVGAGILRTCEIERRVGEIEKRLAELEAARESI